MAITTYPGMEPNPATSLGSSTSTHMNPALLAALIQGGSGLLSSMFGQQSQDAQNSANIEAQRRQFLAALLGQNANLAGDELDDNYRRDQAYMDTFRMNPVQQQQDIFRAAAGRQLAQQGAPHVGPGGVSNQAQLGGVAGQFLSDDALAGAASRFYGAAGALSPSAHPAQLGTMGFGGDTSNYQNDIHSQVGESRALQEKLRQRQRDALYASIMSTQSPNGVYGHSVANQPNFFTDLAGLTPPTQPFGPSGHMVPPGASPVPGTGVPRGGGSTSAGNDYFTRRPGGR